MLDKQDLQAITQLMAQLLNQQKLELLNEMAQQKQEIFAEMGRQMAQQKQEIFAEMDRRMAQQKREILDEVFRRMDTQRDEILAESTHRMQVLIDAQITPQFNLLAEQIQTLTETQVPAARVEALETEVSVHRTVIRQINEDLQRLKKAQ